MALDVSVVIPVYNESPNLGELHRELTDTLGAWGRSYELLFVDDGSTDDSYAILERLQAADPRVRVVRFRRNFGQTAGFSAGFAFARGSVIVTSDGDRQNDPRDIPALVEKLNDGHDIVCGWRRDRKDKFLTRRVPSMIANRLISSATGVDLHDYGCSLKAFRAEVVKPLRLYGEMHRFIPAIASELGVQVAEMVVHHRPRTAGSSKYGLSRTVRVILDLLTVKFLLKYATRPLQIFGLVGLSMGTLGGLIVAYLAFVRLFMHQGIGDRPLLLFGILLAFTGVQFLTFGLLAEIQIRTYYESQNKPTYVVRNVLEANPPVN
jgi:glycosyltransferase involved in cell wall biosynthesis